MFNFDKLMFDFAGQINSYAGHISTQHLEVRAGPDPLGVCWLAFWCCLVRPHVAASSNLVFALNASIAAFHLECAALKPALLPCTFQFASWCPLSDIVRPCRPWCSSPRCVVCGEQHLRSALCAICDEEEKNMTHLKTLGMKMYVTTAK